MFGLSVTAAKIDSIINLDYLEVEYCHKNTHVCGIGLTVR